MSIVLNLIMCGRYVFYAGEDMFDRFYLDPHDNRDFQLNQNYNVSPGQFMPVVIPGSAKNQLSLMRWGLIPAWAKDPQIGYRLINARAESVTLKPSFRPSFRRHRCLVPANGFYEWQKGAKTKTPFYFTLKDQPLFAFAGLYDSWLSPDGSPLATFTIITSEANDLVLPIHSRMPIILKPQDEGLWLDPHAHESDLTKILTPYPSNLMQTYPVSSRLNRPSQNDPDLIRPV
jgi:putative SOS response-associated peptidase YedK